MEYTIYQNHKSIWCINYFDRSGKRIRRSLGTRKKTEAIQRANEYWQALLEFNVDVPLFIEYGKRFYQPGCPWTEKRQRFNRPLKPQTLQRYRWYLEHTILPYFSGLRIDEVNEKHIYDFALSLEYDGTTKNDILSLVKHIIDEAVIEGYRKQSISIMRFPKSRSSLQAISSDTIQLLWPDDLQELYTVWNMPKMRDQRAPWMYAGMTALMLSAGLRSGEARGLGPEHVELHPTHGIVYVERALDRAGVLSGVKGDTGQGKARVVVFPAKTVRILEQWELVRPASDFYFTEDGTQVTKDRLAKKIHRVCEELQIDERVTPHALRFTYKSRTRALVDEMTSRLMMGHSSEQMSEWYDRPVLKERALQFVEQGVAEKLQGVWE